MARQLGDGHLSPLDTSWLGAKNILARLAALERQMANLGAVGGSRSATPASHHTTHEDGGTDELSVQGLAGVLATAQNADQLQGVDVDDGAPSDDDVLTYDLASDSWKPAAAAAAVGPHDLLSATHTDTDAAATPAEGDVPVFRTDEWTSEAPVDIATDAADITAVNLTEQGSKPTAPGAGHRVIYAKSDGIYQEDSGGTESKVGISDHGALSGLADDDHAQYLNEARHDALDHTGLPGIMSGQYRQFVYEPDGAGSFNFIVDGDGNPLFALLDLE